MVPHIKRILYATDLSKNSSYAFFYAVDLARKYDATIVILHAVGPSRTISYAGSRVQEMIIAARKKEQEEDLEEIKNGLHEFCKHAETQIGSPCVELVAKILVPAGYPVEEILKTADEEECDALVLGTHGKGFLKQTFLGSTAEDVLHRTRKPVFIIPLPPEKVNIDWDKM